MHFRRLFFLFYLAALAGLGVTLGFFFLDAYQQYQQLRATELADRRQLDAAVARLREQEVILNRLRSDRGYVERVIRLDLGYAKPDEKIFRFEDSPNGP